MTQSILIPIYACFIGAASAVLGTLYSRSLPAFPLTAWWWQWGQRFEISHPNLFKAIWGCADCFSGHVAWVSFLAICLPNFDFHFRDLYVWLFSLGLSAGNGILFSKIFNTWLDDAKKSNTWN